MSFFSILSLIISVVFLAYSIIGYNTALKTREAVKKQHSKYKLLRESVLHLADNADKLEEEIKNMDGNVHEIELQVLEIKNLAARIKRIEGKHAGEERTV